MSRILVLSAIVVASLSTIVGCGASSARPAEAPRDEACWTPPGELAMSFPESKEGTPATTTVAETEKQRMKPNRNERPTSGAVHAATY